MLLAASALKGYAIEASDGRMGTVHDLLYAVREIDWSDRQIRLEVSRSRVKESPPWDPADMIDQAYGEQLHAHYGWPGYGL